MNAQEYPNGLSVDSVRPDLDSIYIKDMRAKLKHIRKTENRPTVALVLSGGGAKGAAQVGVLKVLEEMDIPIDLICGTSIGGMIGGMLAIGYKSDDVEKIFLNQDWSITLTDHILPKYIPYENKIYKSKYLISIPFRYKEEDFNQRVIDQDKYSSDHSGKKFHIGAKQGDDSRYGSNTLASSLPEGYVYGFNVNNLLASYTVGYQDSLAFKDLPIPFFCVASDVVSCKAKIWGSGNLQVAMRSTMSVPGLFDPVRTEGMVLVDGGIRDNFPCDIARAMGADIIIGIDLSDRNPQYSQVNNIAGIFSQFITMLGNDAFNKNLQLCDIRIKPDITEYNLLSFNENAIKTMIQRGLEAAEAKREELESVKMMTAKAVRKPVAGKAVDINRDSILIRMIEFRGVNDKESQILMKRIGLKVGSKITAKEIHTAMSQIQSSGAFERVTYTLSGEGEPFGLHFDCVRGPIHQFGMGIRGDSQDMVAMSFNLGLNTHSLSGSALNLDLKIGRSRTAYLRYIYNSPKLPTINIDAEIGHRDVDVFIPDFTSLKYMSHKERIYLSNINSKHFSFKAGGQIQGYMTKKEWWLNSSDSDFQMPEYIRNGVYAGAFLEATHYTFNNRYYPTRGISLDAGYDLDLTKIGVSGFKPVHHMYLDFKGVVRLGGKVAFIPDIHLCARMNSNPEFNPDGTPTRYYSISRGNFAGGRMKGQYIEQQKPFIGINEAYLAKDIMSIVNLELRVNPVKNLFLSAHAAALKDASTFKDYLTDLRPTIYAGALEIGYNSFLGPLKANIHWSDFAGWQYNLSLGFDF